MKKIIITFILLLLLGSSSVIAQATRSATAEKSPAVTSLDDPKLSPEERALMLTAGEDNPAKIDEAAMIDPKMDPRELPTEEDYGASNARPAEGLDPDPRLTETAQKEKLAPPQPVTSPVSGADQPAGEMRGTITNYRNMSGTNDQPRGEEPEGIPNYRDLQGSNDQPRGDIPNK